MTGLVGQLGLHNKAVFKACSWEDYKAFTGWIRI